MNIWIDGYEANVLQRLGSSQVAFELISHIEKIDKKNQYTILLPDLPLDDMPAPRVGWNYKILKPKRLWTRIALPLALYSAKQKPDIIFSPTHYISRFFPKTIKKVVTIFDLSFLHFPDMFTKKDLWQLKNGTKSSVENADHIITISNFSKQDIIEQYGISNNKITVAYPGYDKDRFKIKDLPAGKAGLRLKIQETKRKYKIGESYIIYIGTLQPRKNLIRLIEAFARIEGDLQLVIVGKSSGEGKSGWMYQDILNAPKKFGIENRVIFTGFVPTEDLKDLLLRAKAFILPSLWEGFGITVVEAMACGVPVIVSDVSSLPEVVGSAGLLIDPYSINQIEQAIRTVVNDKKLQIKYSKASLSQAKNFSWEKMTKTVLKVFELV